MHIPLVNFSATGKVVNQATLVVNGAWDQIYAWLIIHFV